VIYGNWRRGKIITLFRGVLFYRGLISKKDISQNLDPQIRDHREKIIGANLHRDRKKNPFFISRLWAGGIFSSQLGSDFPKGREKKVLTEKFRRNQGIALLNHIEDPVLRCWLKAFIFGDPDNKGVPSFEFAPTIYFGESQYEGQFYPNSIYRPSSFGMGDFSLENPHLGRIHYDIKTNHLFFQPHENLAMEEVEKIISELNGKPCNLLIDGSFQSIENVKNLRNNLSKDSKYKCIEVVHPSESMFEKGLDEYLNSPQNVEYIEIMEDKAKFLTDSAINSRENLPYLVSDYFDENGNHIEISKENFHKANEITDNYLGRIIDPKNPWHIDEMGGGE